MSQQRFSDKIVLVTGGNSGIGLATAQRLVAEGARVIVTGRDPKTLARATQELGPSATGIVGDVTKLADLDALYAQVKERFGHLDGLFANAGVAIFRPVLETSEADFDALMATNVKGLFFTLQKAVPLFSKGGAMVVNASVAGSKGLPLSSVYGATKAAARSFARTFSAELLGRGIRVNVVSPGPIATPIWERPGIPKGAALAAEARVKETNPSKRFGTPEEVAAAVAFLLSSDSTYMAGAEVFVDGGSAQI